MRYDTIFYGVVFYYTAVLHALHGLGWFGTRWSGVVRSRYGAMLPLFYVTQNSLVFDGMIRYVRSSTAVPGLMVLDVIVWRVVVCDDIVRYSAVCIPTPIPGPGAELRVDPEANHGAPVAARLRLPPHAGSMDTDAPPQDTRAPGQGRQDSEVSSIVSARRTVLARVDSRADACSSSGSGARPIFIPSLFQFLSRGEL